jgi:catechol 2,3-dioxygenase-like lactoylglutathione lyase family enzyme
MLHEGRRSEAMNDSAVPDAGKPRLVGINHVALEVGNVEEALAFYGKIFAFTLRGKGKGQAFIDIGDQFLALMETKAPHRDDARHFGLVVDDRSAVRRWPRQPEPRCFRVPSSISSTHGATASRWSSIPISSSARRRRFCARWDLLFPRAGKR